MSGGGGPVRAASSSIEAVIARYTKTVFGVALTHTGNRQDADDVFQEVFLAYHRAHPVFNSEEHCKAWLIRTTLNLSLKVTQGSWRTKAVPMGDDGLEQAALAASSEPPADFTFATSQQDLIWRAMQAIPESYRTALQLFYFEDLPVNTISELLSIAPGAVKTRLSRGRTLLREALEQLNSAGDSQQQGMQASMSAVGEM